MIELTDCDERVSIFKFPVISIKCPQGWIDEAVRYDDWMSQGSNDFFRGWNTAKRISKRAFAAYFGLQSQFLDNHHKWSRNRTYTDFMLSHNGVEYDIAIQAIPIKDYKPRIGKEFFANVWKVKPRSDRPVIHIFCSWWTPVVFILGWISNESLGEGKQSIKEDNLRPIYEHPALAALDTRNMYV